MSLPTNKLYFIKEANAPWRQEDSDSFVLPSNRTTEAEVNIGVFTTLCSYYPEEGSQSSQLIFPTLEKHLKRLEKNFQEHPRLASTKENPNKNQLEPIRKKVLEISKISTIASTARLRILASAKNTELYLDSYQNPWREIEDIKVCSFASQRKLPNCKHIPARTSIEAKKHAIKQNCHEAILLNENNELLEGAWSNILWFDKAGELHSPADEKILPGVTRSILQDIRPITFSSLEQNNLKKEVAEIFLTQSTSGITAIRYFDELDLGAKTPHTNKLQKEYQEELTRLSRQA